MPRRNEDSGLIDLDALNAELVTREAATRATAALDEMRERLLAKSGPMPADALFQLSARLAVARTRLVDIAATGKRPPRRGSSTPSSSLRITERTDTPTAVQVVPAERDSLSAVTIAPPKAPPLEENTAQTWPVTRGAERVGRVPRASIRPLTIALTALLVAGTTTFVLSNGMDIEDALTITARSATRSSDTSGVPTRGARAAAAAPIATSPLALPAAAEPVPLPSLVVRENVADVGFVVPPSAATPNVAAARKATTTSPAIVAPAPHVAAVAAPVPPPPPTPAKEAEVDPFGTPAANEPLAPAAAAAVAPSPSDGPKTPAPPKEDPPNLDDAIRSAVGTRPGG